VRQLIGRPVGEHDQIVGWGEKEALRKRSPRRASATTTTHLLASRRWLNSRLVQRGRAAKPQLTGLLHQILVLQDDMESIMNLADRGHAVQNGG